MKISELTLTETPRDIGDVDFGLEDKATNHSLFVSITNSKKYSVVEAIGKFKLYKGSREYILVNVDTELVVYYMKWKDVFHKLIGANCASQIVVWYSGGVHGTPGNVFFKHLLPTHDAIVSDSEQSPAGRRFWGSMLVKAFNLGLNVYYVNLLPSKETGTTELIKINNKSEFDELESSRGIWGNDPKFRAQKLVITSKELSKPTGDVK